MLEGGGIIDFQGKKMPPARYFSMGRTFSRRYQLDRATGIRQRRSASSWREYPVKCVLCSDERRNCARERLGKRPWAFWRQTGIFDLIFEWVQSSVLRKITLAEDGD